ncbi:hypothetical protein SK128_016058 [Halocaridina rubra]|uniref:Aspartyl protease n=1 Tax=Halocaridina rubra TaxID=373956 RepID=A0AAN8XIE5_HALRR
MEGRSVSALIDAGNSCSALAPWECGARGVMDLIRSVNGDAVRCVGSSVVTVSVGGVAVVMDCVVTESLVDRIGAVLGVNLIEKLGGLEFYNGKVTALNKAPTGWPNDDATKRDA